MDQFEISLFHETLPVVFEVGDFLSFNYIHRSMALYLEVLHFRTSLSNVSDIVDAIYSPQIAIFLSNEEFLSAKMIANLMAVNKHTRTIMFKMFQANAGPCAIYLSSMGSVRYEIGLQHVYYGYDCNRYDLFCYLSYPADGVYHFKITRNTLLAAFTGHLGHSLLVPRQMMEGQAMSCDHRKVYPSDFEPIVSSLSLHDRIGYIIWKARLDSYNVSIKTRKHVKWTKAFRSRVDKLELLYYRMPNLEPD